MKWYAKLFCVLSMTPLIQVYSYGGSEFKPIEGELIDRAVVIQLPEGVRRIRLRVQLEDGTWETRTMAHLKGTEGYVKLRLPDGVKEDAIEIAASWSDPFPFEFYSGTSNFDPTQTDNNTNRAATGPDFKDAEGSQEATVVESDIWKWRGSVLYFFNQYRGLQVIDVADPAAPVRMATMRVPSSGEQLYLHPTDNVAVLLTYDPNAGNGQILLIEHTDSDTLHKIQAIPVGGYIVESRMVDSILYVVSRQWWQESVVDPESQVEHVRWQSGLVVSKIDLADPFTPVSSDPLELRSDRYDYWGGQVQATAEALLITTNEYNRELRQSISTVHVVDISDPAVDPVAAFQVPVKGQVLNKFNMQLKDNILTVASQVWRWSEDRRRFASVETFDLSEPSGDPIEALAQLEFANNESITATRFADDLLYVVTFLRIDPLFVIDLSDPANPQLIGELEVPGFSTHIETLGEEALITVGVEDSQIALSWFDVSDPAEPTLVSRVLVGEEYGRSWTEANWDEKAFGFFPADGWILLPYQGYVPDEGWVSGIQIVKIGGEELIKRGSFEHEFQARRARVVNEAVVSISGRSLKSLDISDPDNPILLADLTLAWPVDFAHRVGDYLVHVERGPGYWYYGSNDASARIHVSPADDPDKLITSLDLKGGRVVGSFVKDDCLMVAQSNFHSGENDEKIWEYTNSFTHTVLDVSNPEAPSVLGLDTYSNTTTTYSYGFGSDFGAELLPSGELVWYPAEQNFHFFLDVGIGGARAGAEDFLYPYFPASGLVYTVSIFNKAEPEILSAVRLLGSQDGEFKNSYWTEGTVRLLGSTLYYGLQSSVYLEREGGPPQWMAQHWLGQLDLYVPALPQKRDLVEIPGTFENVINTDEGGVLLFTSSFRSFYDNEVWRSEFHIQALAFDGLDAFLIEELELEQSGFGPKVFSGNFFVIGSTDYSSGDPVTSLTTYEWLDSGSFLEHPTLEHPGTVYRLGVIDDLLVAPGSAELSFIDFVDPADPERNTVSFSNLYFWQRIELIDIYKREIAYVPQGFYGVDILDFEGAFGQVSESLELPRMQSNEEEWVTLTLRSLIQTGGDDGVLIEELDDQESWIFSESVDQLSYKAWIQSVLGLEPGEDVPDGNDDSDGDGISNSWEYFAGSHPGSLAYCVPFESWVSTGQSGERYINIRLAYNLHAMEGIQTIPQFSEDLQNWIPFPEAFEMTEEDFSTARVYRYLEPVESLENLFLRLLLSTD